MVASFRHDVPTAGFGQATYEQCWYASYKMLLWFLRRSYADLEPKLAAAGIDVADAKAKGLVDNDYRRAAEALGLQWWSGLKFNQSSFFDYPYTSGAKAFLDELVKGPLWCSRIAGSGYHAVLAIGWDDTNSKFLYNNPFPGPDNAIQQSMTANTFVKFFTRANASVQGRR